MESGPHLQTLQPRRRRQIRQGTRSQISGKTTRQKRIPDQQPSPASRDPHAPDRRPAGRSNRLSKKYGCIRNQQTHPSLGKRAGRRSNILGNNPASREPPRKARKENLSHG